MFHQTAISAFSEKTCLEAQIHNRSLNKHYIPVAQTFDDPSGVIPSVNRTVFYIFSNKALFKENQSMYRLRILESQGIKMNAADATVRAREFS